MNVKEIIDLAYFKTNTSNRQYPEDKMLLQLNKAYRKVWRAILRADEKYFWNYWFTDLQQDVTEYEIQRKEVTQQTDAWEVKIPWIAKIRRVSLVNDVLCNELPQLDEYHIPSSWYNGWYLADNHIILNFKPIETVEGGLKVEGIMDVNDLTLESTAEDIFPWHEDLGQFHDVISLALEVELWRGKQDLEKMQFANQEYEVTLKNMLDYITQRVQNIYYTNLEY